MLVNFLTNRFGVCDYHRRSPRHQGQPSTRATYNTSLMSLRVKQRRQIMNREDGGAVSSKWYLEVRAMKELYLVLADVTRQPQRPPLTSERTHYDTTEPKVCRTVFSIN